MKKIIISDEKNLEGSLGTKITVFTKYYKYERILANVDEFSIKLVDSKVSTGSVPNVANFYEDFKDNGKERDIYIPKEQILNFRRW